MSADSQPIPQAPVLDHSVLDAELAWQKNKPKVIAGAAAVLIGGALAIGWFAYSNATTQAAQNLLAEADGINGYQSVVSKYPGTMPAADALLRLAAAQRDAGKLEESTTAFRDFLKKFPKHPLAGAALLGVGQNQDAAGESQSAIATYQQVVTQFPKSFAAPYASYSEAEIYLRNFQRDEARRSYNMITSQYPQSIVARMAAGQLARLGATSAPASIVEPAVSAEPVKP